MSEVTIKRVEMYRDANGEFRWRAIANNSRIVADSGEGYKNAKDCLSAAQGVIGTDRLKGLLVYRTT